MCDGSGRVRHGTDAANIRHDMRRHAPEIDGVVYVKKRRRKVNVGDFVDVTIASAEEHDLHGKLA